VRHVDGFPALLPGSGEVPGELYDIEADHLARLDAFEGEAYVRRLVTLADGASVQAYFLAEPALGGEEGRAAGTGRW
jgi:gamma-glutamylcyclotransferase (GGCT)/AIG2-like uncharacterized protein YtfP